MTQVVRCGKHRYVFEPSDEFRAHVIAEGDVVFIEQFEGAPIGMIRPARVGEIYDIDEPSGGLPRVVGLWVAQNK